MRISTSWSQQASLNAMQSQQASLNKTQMQLSTALKILTPSDDPVAATKALAIQSTLAQTSQYQENINTAKANNALEDSTLTTMVNAIKKARDLAVQSLNSGTLSGSDRQAIGQEIQQILGDATSLTNTITATGEYLFSGYQSKTAPFAETTAATATTAAVYTYQGGTDQRMLQVDPKLQIANGDPGSDIFAFNDINGAPQNILNTLSNFANTLANPYSTPTDPNDQTALNKVLNDLDAGLHQISVTQAKTGARLNALDVQTGQSEQYTVDLKSNLSSVQDLDYADAITRFNQQQTVLQAAQQSFSKVQKLSLFDYIR